MPEQIVSGTRVLVYGDPAHDPQRGTVVCFYRAYPQDLMVRFADQSVCRVPRIACKVVGHAA